MQGIRKIGGGALAASLAPSVAGKARTLSAKVGLANEAPYAVKWYPFLGHPESASYWSLSVGPDGRIYAAACAEGVPGDVVKPVRYNEQHDDLDYLFDLAEKVNDSGDSRLASQCKIHYSFAPSMHDGSCTSRHISPHRRLISR